MEEWQQRVFEEREDLEMKISKLEHFLDVTDVTYDNHSSIDLLRKQLEYMRNYCDVLNERIEQFK
jgi:hypothetical protein